jgi:hypothetical protein
LAYISYNIFANLWHDINYLNAYAFAAVVHGIVV